MLLSMAFMSDAALWKEASMRISCVTWGRRSLRHSDNTAYVQANACARLNGTFCVDAHLPLDRCYWMTFISIFVCCLPQQVFWKNSCHVGPREVLFVKRMDKAPRHQVILANPPFVPNPDGTASAAGTLTIQSARSAKELIDNNLILH